MGGKQQNRTKNNVRPSNSGRSAAMLHSSLPQFAGFSGANKSTGLTGFSSFAFATTEELDPSIDETFQLVLKKVSKKDSTTKLKGLQEFAVRLQNAELPVLKSLLPVWPRFYHVLAIHPDNRIREATQNAHHIIVLRAKRDIAPYLKQLMAPWYTSQYDNYPPAATAAIQAFKDTFSPIKFKEAVNFCHLEILNYIHDSLLNQSAQTIGSNQLSPEEAEARYERIVISCLQGYAMYLKDISEEKITEYETLNAEIVSNKKFWRLAASKVCLIRSSWFQVLSVILQKAEHLLKTKEAQTLSTVLNNLEDVESPVLPHVWECLLLATSNAEWWKCINIDQHFIPKILHVLKQGGNGKATIIYPNFLPLLSNMPQMEEKRKKQFYTHFFENMGLGIRLKPVAGSGQESKAIAVAYIECLQFLITKNVSNLILCKTLTSQFIISLIDWCITKEAVSYKTIFEQISNFLLYLQRNYALDEIKLLTEHFFNCLYDTFCLSFAHPNSIYSLKAIAEKQVELLLNFKAVKKADLKDENDFFANIIDKCGIKTFRLYLNYTEQVSSNELLPQLYNIINMLGKKVVFQSILEQLKEDDPNSSYMDMYRMWLQKWLTSEKMYCESVLDLIFLLIAELQDSEKETILNDLMQVNQPNCLTCSVSRALTYQTDDQVVKTWLRGKIVGNLLSSIADKYISNECSPELASIFKSALGDNSHGEILIDKEILENIIAKLSDNILNDSNENISKDTSCKLAAQICKVIYTTNYQMSYGDQLLLTLFNSSCKFNCENYLGPISTEVNAAWQNGLKCLLQCLSDTECQSLFEKLLEGIESNFKDALVFRHRGHVDHLNQIVEIIYTIYRSHKSILAWLISYILKKSNTFKENIIGYCLVAEYVKGHFDSPYEEISSQSSINEDQILSYFIYYFLKVHLFSICLLDNQRFNVKDSSDVKTTHLYENSVENLSEMIYSFTLTNSFLANFNSVKHYNELLHHQRLLEEKICNILRNIDNDTLKQLKMQLETNRTRWFSSKAMYIFHITLLKSATFNADREVTKNITNSIDNRHFIDTLESYNSLSAEALIDKCSKLFTELEIFRNENVEEFLYENTDISWEYMNRLIKSVNQCTELMTHSPLNQEYWDFLVLSMVSWVSNCLRARRLIMQYEYQRMLVSVSELFMATVTKLVRLKEEQTDCSYVNEWEDILLESVHADLAQFWLFIAIHFTKSNKESLLNLPLLQSFGRLTDFIRQDLIFKGNDVSPKWTKFFKTSYTLITNSQEILQLWGYKMLSNLSTGLVKIDDEAVNTTTPHKNGLIFEQFKQKLMEVQDIVNSVLNEFRIGESSCKVEPSYDSFTYTFAYLLLWDVILRLYGEASTELRYQYLDWLKNGSLLHQFLSNLFKLMPIEVLQQDEGRTTVSTNAFLQCPVDSSCYSKCCGSDTIENMACYLYKSSVEQFPALVRQWWTVLDLRTSQIVEKVTVLFVSPHICNTELDNVLQHQNMFKNLKVKVMPSVREIQSVYTVDETQMELTITLPTNYPLGSPNIVCNRQISGTSQKQWLLQFKKCVLHQNGKIWDGLSLWNSNLDRKFDGVEECYICYAVLHSGTYQLPKLCCRTCKKKFHSACLFKWFSTSNKSSCPICRNLF